MKNEKFKPYQYLIFILIFLFTLILCVSIGSVRFEFREVINIFCDYFRGVDNSHRSSIILQVRFPRVLAAALVGAILSITGASMQGLLRNPLADGGTMGIVSGASLGAVLSIALGFSTGMRISGVVLMSILFSFISIMVVLFLSYRLDYSLSTTTIILLGVVFSMFTSSLRSFIIVFSSNKLEAITTWSLGSLSGNSYFSVLLMFISLVIFGGILIYRSTELDALSLGEENAMNIGVDVKRVKLEILISVSILIGICVSFSGTIGFVGLVVPHILRRIFGPGHRKLLISSIFGGSIFLMLMDLVSRTILSPIEIPVGVITSFIGSIIFIYTFYKMRSK